MPGKLPLFLIAAVLFLLQGAATAEAATLEGTVTTSDGRAVSGAMTDPMRFRRRRTSLLYLGGMTTSASHSSRSATTATRSAIR
jgi:hypothetical protein